MRSKRARAIDVPRHGGSRQFYIADRDFRDVIAPTICCGNIANPISELHSGPRGREGGGGERRFAKIRRVSESETKARDARYR